LIAKPIGTPMVTPTNPYRAVKKIADITPVLVAKP
jgi:hypothetical protein